MLPLACYVLRGGSNIAIRSLTCSSSWGGKPPGIVLRPLQVALEQVALLVELVRLLPGIVRCLTGVDVTRDAHDKANNDPCQGNPAAPIS
jgi:hypothetical protein